MKEYSNSEEIHSFFLPIRRAGNKYNIWFLITFFYAVFPGYKFEELESCVNWMAPFAITIRDRNEPNPEVKEFDNVMEEDHHNIQTHDITIETLVSPHIN